MIVIQFAGPWAAIYDNFPYSWLLPGQDWTPIGLKESLYPWKMIKMVLGSSASQSKPLWVTTIGFDGPWAAFFDSFPHFRPFSGQVWTPTDPVEWTYWNISISMWQGSPGPRFLLVRLIVIVLFGPWAAISYENLWFLAIFGPEMKPTGP